VILTLCNLLWFWQIADFGMAVLRQATESLTKHGAGGTIRWMAPERLDGEPMTPAADVYSYSMTMFEMYSGGEEPLSEVSDAAVSLPLALYVMLKMCLNAWYVCCPSVRSSSLRQAEASKCAIRYGSSAVETHDELLGP
jgi:serine/threonine protein kinase